MKKVADDTYDFEEEEHRQAEAMLLARQSEWLKEIMLVGGALFGSAQAEDVIRAHLGLPPTYTIDLDLGPFTEQLERAKTRLEETAARVGTPIYEQPEASVRGFARQMALPYAAEAIAQGQLFQRQTDELAELSRRWEEDRLAREFGGAAETWPDLTLGTEVRGTFGRRTVVRPTDYREQRRKMRAHTKLIKKIARRERKRQRRRQS